MPRRLLPLLVMVVALAGCGPTHTAGTKGKSAKDLAVLTIAQPEEIPVMRIQSIQFDDGDEFEIGKGRDFYLTPGEHTASFAFKIIIEGPSGWFIPSKAITVPGPKGVPLGAVAAGKKYEMNGLVEGFENLVSQGQMTLVREKKPPPK